MKHTRIILAIAVLVLSSLACQAVMGGGESNDASPSDSSAQPGGSSSDNGSGGDSGSSVESDFPMTSDAFNVTDMGDMGLIYYTKLSADEALQFYRDEFSAKGYTEREILTVISDGTFSIVFDGDPSGKAVVIQSVDLGDGSRTISIRLEDV